MDKMRYANFQVSKIINVKYYKSILDKWEIIIMNFDPSAKKVDNVTIDLKCFPKMFTSQC